MFRDAVASSNDPVRRRGHQADDALPLEEERSIEDEMTEEIKNRRRMQRRNSKPMINNGTDAPRAHVTELMQLTDRKAFSQPSTKPDELTMVFQLGKAP